MFGFAWREPKERAYQEFATLPEFLLGKVSVSTHLERVSDTVSDRR